MDIVMTQQVLDMISYGLYIVTSHDGLKLNGQISNTVVQVAAVPPRIAVCINKDELTHEYIVKSGEFAVSILEKSAPMKFIGLFGYKTGREVDKLSKVSYKMGVTNCPIVTDYSISAIELKVVDRVDVETHSIFIGEIVNTEFLGEGEALTYSYFRNVKHGRSPMNAPTYRPASKIVRKKDVSIGKYRCSVCGYVYDSDKSFPNGGVKPGTLFVDLPEDWACPLCRAGKDRFLIG